LTDKFLSTPQKSQRRLQTTPGETRQTNAAEPPHLKKQAGPRTTGQNRFEHQELTLSIHSLKMNFSNKTITLFDQPKRIRFFLSPRQGTRRTSLGQLLQIKADHRLSQLSKQQDLAMAQDVSTITTEAINTMQQTHRISPLLQHKSPVNWIKNNNNQGQEKPVALNHRLERTAASKRDARICQRQSGTMLK